MPTVSVRYIVNDVDEAIAFYSEHLGFHEELGVPVKIRSQGSQPSSKSSGLPNSSGVTSQGPTGPKPGYDLPRLNCGGVSAIWVIRSDTSWPTESPATKSHADLAGTRAAARPMTTSSTS